ncbi:YfcL family protein [Paraglaciecola sp.]|uniref:YfcL family protein n=1 Tax=Paraglaciecola sp. TaxID=1920173 RepID=UPI0030F3FB5D
MTITTIIAHAEAYFSDVVDKGSDQQLFISGYLQGHFTLVLATVVQQNIQSAEQFKAILLASLDAAFAKHELEIPDQIETKALVEQLFSLTVDFI